MSIIDPATISPPEEFLTSPEVTETTIKDLVDKDPLLLTSDDIFQLVRAMRVSRAQFAQLDLDKSRGNAPKGQRKPKSYVPKANVAAILSDLGIELDLDLGLDPK